MKEKWLTGYSNFAEDMPAQSGWSVVITLVCALFLFSLLCAGSLFAAAPIHGAMPAMPTPPDHIEAVEPTEALPAPAQLEEIKPKREAQTKAEEILKAPPIIEPPMPSEVEKALEATQKAAPAEIAQVQEQLSALGHKVHALEIKQALFENELKHIRHQAEQPEDKDIQYSSAPLENIKVTVPSIEEISSVDEL